MMNRREFCQRLSLLVGCQLLPEQAETLVETYMRSSVGIPDGKTIAVYDLQIGFGGKPIDAAHLLDFQSGNRIDLCFEVNHRSFVRWVAIPGREILTTVAAFHWTPAEWMNPQGASQVNTLLQGHVRYIDSDLTMRTRVFDCEHTRLSELHDETNTEGW